MEPIESSETSAYINTLTPGTYPKEKKLLTTNLHLMSLSSCELRTNCLTLLKGIIAVISVEEVTAVPSDKISKTLNNRKPEEYIVMALLRQVCCQGVITM